MTKVLHDYGTVQWPASGTSFATPKAKAFAGWEQEVVQLTGRYFGKISPSIRVEEYAGMLRASTRQVGENIPGFLD